MMTLLITFLLIVLAIAAMAIGVIVNKNKSKGELKGSCGGPKKNPHCCMKQKNNCDGPSK